jgi:hypothetical protein
MRHVGDGQSRWSAALACVGRLDHALGFGGRLFLVGKGRVA